MAGNMGACRLLVSRRRAWRKSSEMRLLTETIRVETERRGANYGVVVTTEGAVLIDTPFKPSDAVALRSTLDAEGLPVRFVVNTEPHIDHWTGNAFFDAPVVGHEGVRARILAFDPEEFARRMASLGPDEPAILGARPKRAPSITFRETLTLHLGHRTVRMIAMPGHTPFQAAVLIEEEGVVFTSDNLFFGVHTWLQEADPGVWLRTLGDLRALDARIYVPGHGAATDRSGLDTQGAVIREWLDHVGDGIARGLTREEAMEQLTGMHERFPMGPGQKALRERVMRMNVANLYDYLTRQGIHATD